MPSQTWAYGLLVGKAADIPDLSHQLGSHGFADAGHGHDGLILRELGGQPVHLGAVGLHRAGDGVELGNRFPDQQFAGVRLGYQRKLLPGVRVQVDGRLLGEVIAVTLAPLPVSLHKGALTDPGDTVHMPEGVHIVHPFLAAVRPHRAVKYWLAPG